MDKVETRGRKPLYSDVDILQSKIDEYFKTGVKTKEVVIGKGSDKERITVRIPTITGLVLYLGFESRTAFYSYEEKPLFKYTIKKARTRIENEYEEALRSGNTVGAIFALKNMGWTDKVEQALNINYPRKVYNRHHPHGVEVKISDN